MSTQITMNFAKKVCTHWTEEEDAIILDTDRMMDGKLPNERNANACENRLRRMLEEVQEKEKTIKLNIMLVQKQKAKGK